MLLPGDSTTRAAHPRRVALKEAGSSVAEGASVRDPEDVLYVDLSRRRAERIAPGRGELGGAGLAVALLAEEIGGAIDPLGPENALVFAAGPFAGTTVPAGTKHAFATVSPLTGRVNDGLSSSHWSASLRKLGLAALVVRGAAADWTVLAIDDAGVRFLDGSALIGMSAAETAQQLRTVLGDRRWRSAAIGPAGERGVSFATIDNDGRQAGRGGGGAVMGAKRLKAIALFGTREIAVADPQGLRERVAPLRERALGAATAKYRILGTGANLRVLQRMGMLPTRNFSAATFDGTEGVTPERARDSATTYVARRTGCAGCPVQCEHMYVRRERDPRFAASSDYESIWAFGPNCGVGDLDAVLDAIERCDRYGLDTISAGGTIAFAMECAERGWIDSDAFGTPLRFGNAAALGPALEAIAAAQGLGAILGLGVRGASERIGAGSAGSALHVKGLEMPGYEPRALPTYALALAVCTRGACHNRAAAYDADLRDPGNERDDATRARDVVEAEDFAIAWDSLVLCKFIRGCFDDFWSESAALYTAASGRTLDARELQALARRTWQRKRALNVALGWTPAEDALPPRFAQPLEDGPHAGAAIDPERLERQRVLYEALRASIGDLHPLVGAAVA